MTAAPRATPAPGRAAPAPGSTGLPILLNLDATSREAIASASRRVELAAGQRLYGEGDRAEVLYAVLAGAVSLRAVRRGDTEPTVLRVARRSDTFGHEAALAGVGRRASAIADESTTLLEIPMPVFRRAVARSGGNTDREQRYLRREVLRDLLAASSLSSDLLAEDLAVLIDAARLSRFARTERIFEPGDSAGDVFIVLDGLVQIQTERDGEVTVQAYLSRGDCFGDLGSQVTLQRPAEHASSAGAERRVRSTAAVAMGDTWCARVRSDAVRRISDRYPDLLRRVRRVDRSRPPAQDEIGDPQSTQHVLRDLYRMQIARSLLVIDQDSCVRCGHCAWSCAETHGVSRLVRRGDRVAARLLGAGSAKAPSALLVPNSCQQCRNAACMIDCPTGAIGRDVGGEVFIREQLCTGCGNCAKACPWDNIQMAPRPAGSPGPAYAAQHSSAGSPAASAAQHSPASLSPEIAVKCDLCRDYEAPACVQACPTESLLRLDPSRDIAEVRHVLGSPATLEDPAERASSAGTDAPAARRRTEATLWIGGAAGAGLAVAGLGLARQLSGAWIPGSGAGLAAGILAGLTVIALAGYSVPKRLVSLWMKPRQKGLRAADPPVARSRTRPHLIAHGAMGLLSAGLAVAHSGLRLPAGAAGALVAAFWLAAAVGAAGGIMYWLVPRRLSRLERRGDLPEDLAAERRALIDRIYRETTGRSELVKSISTRILIPYSKSSLGPLALVLSGRTVRDERRRLRARIDAILLGRGGDRLAGLDDLVATVVETRALPARRWLSAALRGWLPVHIVVSAVAVGLLVLHVATEVLW